MNDRVCSCHFKDGKKENKPTIFPWVKENNSSYSNNSIGPSTINAANELTAISGQNQDKDKEILLMKVNETILKFELENAKLEIKKMKECNENLKLTYCIESLDDETLRMETGLPSKDTFSIICSYTKRFINDIKYVFGWKVEKVTFENQILITLMKLKQNYTALHLARIFGVSRCCISNIG